MVCRVELERSILQSWLTNFTSNTKKYKKTVPLTENFTAPIVSDSPARIAGTITGYDPRFFDRIEIAFYSPIVGDGAT